MVIHTSDGEVHENEWEFLKSKVFDPRAAEPPQQDLNSLFNDLSTPKVDANGNPMVPAKGPRSPAGALESDMTSEMSARAKQTRIPQLEDIPEDWTHLESRNGRSDEDVLKKLPEDYEAFKLKPKSDWEFLNKEKQSDWELLMFRKIKEKPVNPEDLTS